jgi:hypothetical protein
MGKMFLKFYRGLRILQAWPEIPWLGLWRCNMDNQELSLEEQHESLAQEIATIDEAVRNTKTELDRLKRNKAENKQHLSRQAKSLWEGLDKTSPKAVLDKLYKISNPENTQLSESIGKLEISLELLGQERSEKILEMRKIQKQIDENRYDSQAKAVFHALGDFIKLAQKAESSLEMVKGMIHDCEDPHYFKRAKILGHPAAYEVICDSHLKRETLDRMGMMEVLERIANLGETYGPALLQKSPSRQEHIPLTRDYYYEGYGNDN